MNKIELLGRQRGKGDALTLEADEARRLSQMSDDCYWMNTDLHRLGRQRGY